MQEEAISQSTCSWSFFSSSVTNPLALNSIIHRDSSCTTDKTLFDTLNRTADSTNNSLTDQTHSTWRMLKQPSMNGKHETHTMSKTFNFFKESNTFILT